MSVVLLANEAIDEAVLRYRRERDRYEKLADVVYQHSLRLVRNAGIQATVQRRSKSPESLRKKLLRIQRSTPPDTRFVGVDSIFEHMSDLAGVRIATYLESDREKATAAVAEAFEVLDSDVKDKSGRAKHYRAIHCQVKLKTSDDPNEGGGELDNILETTCEVQVCSMLAHVWNEIEHDIGYKPDNGAPGDAENDNLEVLGQLVRAGDHVIHALITAHEQRLRSSTDDDSPFGSDLDFAIRMQPYFPDATNFSHSSSQLFDALLEFHLDSPKRIRDQLLGAGDAYKAKATRLIAEVNAYLQRTDDKVVQLDGTTSDLLAVLFLDRKYRDFLTRNPTGRAMGRPSRLVSLAKRFEWMRQASG